MEQFGHTIPNTRENKIVPCEPIEMGSKNYIHIILVFTIIYIYIIRFLIKYTYYNMLNLN